MHAHRVACVEDVVLVLPCGVQNFDDVVDPPGRVSASGSGVLRNLYLSTLEKVFSIVGEYASTKCPSVN